MARAWATAWRQDSGCTGPSRSMKHVGEAAAPLHPLRIVQYGLEVGDASAFEEHGQVVVAVGGTQALSGFQLPV